MNDTNIDLVEDENWLIIDANIRSTNDFNLIRDKVRYLTDSFYKKYDKKPLIQEIYYSFKETHSTACNESHTISKSLKMEIKTLKPTDPQFIQDILKTLIGLLRREGILLLTDIRYKHQSKAEII